MAISECQDLTLSTDLCNSAHTQKLFLKGLWVHKTPSQGPCMKLGYLLTGVPLGVGQGLANYAILSQSLATRGSVKQAMKKE